MSKSMQTIDQGLDKLEKSKFRSSFRLMRKELEYISEKGMAVMRGHATDFVRQKLAPSDPINDGKQTPMHGHPVFKAMHATLLQILTMDVDMQTIRTYQL